MASSAKLDPSVLANASAPVPPLEKPPEKSAMVSAPFDFLDLKAQFATIRHDVMAAIARVMESQHFILGSEVRLFEEEFAAQFGFSHAVSCGSGSDALVLALLAAGVGAGHEVITTPFTFVATAGSIARVGATPVFVDIDPANYNIDPNAIEAAITPKTRAIMPVHLFGQAANMGPILELAKALNLTVVEDAAQAIGAKYGEKFAGDMAEFGCFSFFPSKNLGGAGDGGMVTTRDANLASRLRLLRVHGSSKKYHHDILGTNSRLDALQAAILRVKLKHLGEWTGGREARAYKYYELFAQMDLLGHLTLPSAPPNPSRHVFNQFSIRCKERDALRDYLQSAGIPTEIYYPLPLHLQPAFSYLGYSAGQFPHSEAASREVLALPVYPELTEAQQIRVVQTIANFYRK
jgi:dTDP-4-amino-4,6-dideoxygalactose transaminase